MGAVYKHRDIEKNAPEPNNMWHVEREMSQKAVCEFHCDSVSASDPQSVSYILSILYNMGNESLQPQPEALKNDTPYEYSEYEVHEVVIQYFSRATRYTEYLA